MPCTGQRSACAGSGFMACRPMSVSWRGDRLSLAALAKRRFFVVPRARERCDERRQPFCKFVAATQSQPALLHLEIKLDLRCAEGDFRQPPAFLRMAKALADFFAEVLKHGPASHRVQAGAGWRNGLPQPSRTRGVGKKKPTAQ